MIYLKRLKWECLILMYDEFVEMYNNYDVSVKEIKRKVGGNAYSRYRKKAIKNGDIKQRPFNLRFKENYKFYHYDKDMEKFRVRRVINGKYISYGFYDDEETAQKVVARLKEVNWDKKKL